MTGRFRGSGQWIDQKAESPYTIECTIIEGPQHAMVQTVTRLFPIPEGTTVYGQANGVYEERSTVTFVPAGKNRFRVTVESAKGSVQGTGYYFGGQCHYELEISPAVHVEVTVTVGPERMDGIGSSTNNGNFTSWLETLQRQP